MHAIRRAHCTRFNAYAISVCVIISLFLSVSVFKQHLEITTNTKILAFSRITENEMRDPYVNLHLYQVLLNSDACMFDKPFVVMIIHSTPEDFSKRIRIRSTFGSVHEYRGRYIAKIFLMGEVQNKSLQEQIITESKTYGDIVQGNFLDSDSNVLKKHIMGMHWYHANCNADFILKIDDDTFVNPYRLVGYMLHIETGRLKMWCKVASGYKPLRDRTSKYYTPLTQYPYEMYPDFCLGFAYLATPEAWKAMYKASAVTRAMTMEDVYVGVLSMRAKVQQIDFSELVFLCVKLSEIDIEKIDKLPFVFDPHHWCGDIPYKKWKAVAP